MNSCFAPTENTRPSTTTISLSRSANVCLEPISKSSEEDNEARVRAGAEPLKLTSVCLALAFAFACRLRSRKRIYRREWGPCRRQADCRHVGFLETQRVTGFFKMVAPGWVPGSKQKTYVDPRQADCRHVGIFETQRVSGFLKMVAPGRGGRADPRSQNQCRHN